MEDKTQKDLEKILFVLKELDEDKLLTNEPGINLISIENNLKEKYTNVEQFQADFDKLCRNILSVTADKEKITSVSALWKLGNNYLSDIRSQQGPQTNGVTSSSYQPNEVQNDFHRNIALFQRCGDGFLFTSSKRGFKPNEHLDIVGEARPMTIFPTHVSERPPPLGAVCPSSNTPSTPQHRKQESINPLLFVSHDGFSSFAPSMDSSSATLSSQDTTTLYYFKKRRFESDGDTDSDVSTPAESTELPDVHNSVDNSASQIVQDTAVDGQNNANGSASTSISNDNNASHESSEVNSASFVIEENSKLLLKLVEFQEARANNDFSLISPLEQATAKAFTTRMTHILPGVKPSALISSECIEDAINRIPILEHTYRGTLPPNKPFAYATNSALSKGFATNATAIPSYIPKP
ncbi:hypothetical protein K7432_008465 [Basidiobolus ranarum]|uniref:Uncharacterized protein n=1 Tax=Basidiobolus ranarum TaxID=34480 RepID=A0ABR2VZF5_9FUNG